MRKNRGYTLVEMMIVIAIIAVMSGVATITFGVVKKARCSAAVNTFNNQLTSLWVKTRALSQGKKQDDSKARGSDLEKYPLCMQIIKANAFEDIRDGSYLMYLGYEDDSGNFVRKKDSSGNEEPYLCVLPDILTIEYRENTADAPTTLDNNGDNIIIQFNKSDGSVTKGSGTYTFIYNDISYGTVVLNKVTGNHYTTSTR